MNKNLNNNLAHKAILAKKGYDHLPQNKCDLRGNVIRDYEMETKLMAEIELENSLGEIPVSVFDGCRKLSQHISEVSTTPIVRVVKLAPLPTIEREIHFIEKAFSFLEKVFNKIPVKDKDLPVFNQSRENRKNWIYNNFVKKYTFTGFYKNK